jgi:hypothetical protein
MPESRPLGISAKAVEVAFAKIARDCPEKTRGWYEEIKEELGDFRPVERIGQLLGVLAAPSPAADQTVEMATQAAQMATPPHVEDSIPVGTFAAAVRAQASRKSGQVAFGDEVFQKLREVGTQYAQLTDPDAEDFFPFPIEPVFTKSDGTKCIVSANREFHFEGHFYQLGILINDRFRQADASERLYSPSGTVYTLGVAAGPEDVVFMNAYKYADGMLLSWRIKQDKNAYLQLQKFAKIVGDKMVRIEEDEYRARARSLNAGTNGAATPAEEPRSS